MRGSWFSREISVVLSVLILVAWNLAAGSLTAGAGQKNGTRSLSYPDNSGGLEHFVKDLLKAHKSPGGSSEAESMVESLALPDPHRWFSETFGDREVSEIGNSYSNNEKAFLGKLDESLVAADQEGFTDITAKKFEDTCDDQAGEFAYPLLMARTVPIPLYELRMRKENELKRISVFVYVNGGFRYAGPLSMPDEFPPSSEPHAPARIRLRGDLQAARLVHKVVPTYPDVARREHLQGTVRMHAIIATDGSIRQLRVVQGYCSLSKAGLEAVKQWRYSPTLVSGKPVEVDTTIDVIYALRY